MGSSPLLQQPLVAPRQRGLGFADRSCLGWYEARKVKFVLIWATPELGETGVAQEYFTVIGVD